MWYKYYPDRIELYIKVIPQAGKNQIVGIQGEQLKIKLTAPPVDGKANENLIDFLTETLPIKRSQLKIIRGLTSRSKVIEISGPSIKIEHLAQL
ncbi:MAG: DUF167 domain-containing protein [Elusimicrobiota bacterium]